MGVWDSVKKYVVDPVKEAGQSTIDIARGEADSEDWMRAAGTGAGAFLGGPLGAYAGQYLGGKLNEAMNPDEATVPGQDPRITALRKRAAKDAEEFRENLPQYEAAQFRPELMQANIAEGEGRQAVKRATSRRGLLDSGITQRGEADVMTAKASTLAEARANINRQAEQLANLKSDIASQIGVSDTAGSIAAFNDAQQRARDEAAQRRAAYANIGQGLGYAAGAYGAKKKPSGLLAPTQFNTISADPYTTLNPYYSPYSLA